MIGMIEDIHDENQYIGQMMKKAREAKGLSQADMCESTGLTKNHISYMERGMGKASVKMLLGYCRKLGVTPNDILEYEKNNFSSNRLEPLISQLTDKEQKLLEEFLKEIIQKHYYRQIIR